MLIKTPVPTKENFFENIRTIGARVGVSCEPDVGLMATIAKQESMLSLEEILDLKKLAANLGNQVMLDGHEIEMALSNSNDALASYQTSSKVLQDFFLDHPGFKDPVRDSKEALSEPRAMAIVALMLLYLETSSELHGVAIARQQMSRLAA